jgi:hypothetical protein
VKISLEIINTYIYYTYYVQKTVVKIGVLALFGPFVYIHLLVYASF